MSEYPDINQLEQLTAAVGRVEVLGGYSRSFSVDLATGEETPDRYIEKLSDYVSEFALRIALARALRHAHCVAGLDGIITAQSADEITISYADGTEARFVKQATGED